MSLKIAVCLAIVVSASAAQPIDDRFVSAIERVKQSIVPIVCMSSANAENMKVDLVAGTGFFISKAGDFLTAAHVIRKLLDDPKGCALSAIYLPADGAWPQGIRAQMHWFRFVPDKCALSNKYLDLARCATVNGMPPGKVVPVVIEPATPPDGTAVAFTGFPLNSPIPRSARGAISGYGSPDDKHVFEMLIDRNAWPGVSGSPAFLDNGHVVGILVATGSSGADGMSVARTSVAINAFLSDLEKSR